MLGISVYPENDSFTKIKDYLDLAANYGFQRIFSTMLATSKSKSEILKIYQKVFSYAKELGFIITLDISGEIMQKYQLSWKDLSFFQEMHIDVLRLDEGFNGMIESQLTFNPFKIKIELNVASGLQEVEKTLAFAPNKDNLQTSFNFYPQSYSALSAKEVYQIAKKVKSYNLKVTAFVTSQDSQEGPFAVNDGLVTIEKHRHYDLSTQVKELYLLEFIDDIIIGDLFASKREFESLQNLEKYRPIFEVKMATKDKNTIKILEDSSHFNRGDQSAYLVRATQTRLLYKDLEIKPFATNKILKRGDVVLANSNFSRYKAEVHLIKKDHENYQERFNVVGRIKEEEVDLLDLVKKWMPFKLKLTF